jgi:hypothetical protein
LWAATRTTAKRKVNMFLFYEGSTNIKRVVGVIGNRKCEKQHNYLDSFAKTPAVDVDDLCIVSAQQHETTQQQKRGGKI